MHSRGKYRPNWGPPGRRSGPSWANPTLPPPSSSQRKIEDINAEKIELQPEDDVAATIQKVELVASFNWGDAKHATILVPGKYC